ncbi:hypothetical protein F4859DRAFT_518521 [Xylaria cf. heliscus]|nr:hypothetical protein F4859DRAFT_518521 [Xylaria cf. heliscus]
MSRYAHVRVNLPSDRVQDILLAFQDDFQHSEKLIALHVGQGNRSWRADHTIDGSGVSTVSATVRNEPLGTRAESNGRDMLTESATIVDATTGRLFIPFFRDRGFTNRRGDLTKRIQRGWRRFSRLSRRAIIRTSKICRQFMQRSSTRQAILQITIFFLTALSTFMFLPLLFIGSTGYDGTDLHPDILARSTFPRDIVHAFLANQEDLENAERFMYMVRDNILRHPATTAITGHDDPDNMFSWTSPAAQLAELRERLNTTSTALRTVLFHWDRWIDSAAADWAYLGRTYLLAAIRLDALEDLAELGLFDYGDRWKVMAEAEWGNSNSFAPPPRDKAEDGDTPSGGKGKQRKKREGPRIRRRLRYGTRAVLCDGFKDVRVSFSEMRVAEVTPLLRLYADMGSRDAGIFGNLRAAIQGVRDLSAMAAVAVVRQDGGDGQQEQQQQQRRQRRASAELLQSLGRNAHDTLSALDRVTRAARRVEASLSTVCTTLVQWDQNEGIVAGPLPWVDLESDMYDEGGRLHLRERRSWEDQREHDRRRWEGNGQGQGDEEEEEEGRKNRWLDDGLGSGRHYQGGTKGGRRFWDWNWLSWRPWKRTGKENENQAPDARVWTGMPPIYWSARLFEHVAVAVSQHTAHWAWKRARDPVWEPMEEQSWEEELEDWTNAWMQSWES